MEKVIVLFVAAIFIHGSNCDDLETTTAAEPETGLETAACIFGCLDSFQRKGVEDGPTTTETPLDKGCGAVDLDSLLDVCKAYNVAGTCLGSCVNSDTKKMIINGLDYICVRRLPDFKKYMPCFKEHCSSVEQVCGPVCGALSWAEVQWWNQLGVDNKTSSADKSRRRRDADTETTPNYESTTSQQSEETSGDGDDATNPVQMCTFVRCYTNCSQPTMEKQCGKEGFELLKQTAHILLSFIVVPLEQSWASPTNASDSTHIMDTCDGYVSQALKAENGATTTYSQNWSVLLFAVVFVFRRWIF